MRPKIIQSKKLSTILVTDHRDFFILLIHYTKKRGYKPQWSLDKLNHLIKPSIFLQPLVLSISHMFLD